MPCQYVHSILVVPIVILFGNYLIIPYRTLDRFVMMCDVDHMSNSHQDRYNGRVLVVIVLVRVYTSTNHRKQISGLPPEDVLQHEIADISQENL